MSLPRSWLLILLMLLLPFRGAVAAALLCPIVAPAAHGAAALSTVSAPHARSDAGAAHHHGHAQHGGHGEQPGHDQNGSCKLCAAFCCVTPMVAGEAQLPSPASPGAVRFAALPAPPPGFVPDGEKRPPRTS